MLHINVSILSKGLPALRGYLLNDYLLQSFSKLDIIFPYKIAYYMSVTIFDLHTVIYVQDTQIDQ